jgi:hypothetical protein
MMHHTALAGTTEAVLVGPVPHTNTVNQPPSFYITAEIAAAILGVSPRTLERFRMTGGGPKWTTVGRRGRGVRYRRDWLDQWLESRAKGAA